MKIAQYSKLEDFTIFDINTNKLNSILNILQEYILYFNWQHEVCLFIDVYCVLYRSNDEVYNIDFSLVLLYNIIEEDIIKEIGWFYGDSTLPNLKS